MSAAAFERELEIFRTEAEGAAQFLYAYLSIHETAGKHAPVFRLLNTAALFWNTNLAALQLSAFIVLGRDFDQSSKHNVDRVLKIAQDNLNIFSKAELGRRKQGASATPPDWLGDYLSTSYVPGPADFRRLRKLVKKNRKIYEERYEKIRHSFAHKMTADPEEMQKLFANTNIRELQRLTTFMGSLYDALWELFFNGRKPVIRQRRYSVKAMHRKPTPPRWGTKVQERITMEASRFLQAAAKHFSANGS
jgi:hypothetical protein